MRSVQYDLCHPVLARSDSEQCTIHRAGPQRHKAVDALMDFQNAAYLNERRDTRMPGRHRRSASNEPTLFPARLCRACPDRWAGKGRYRPPNRPSEEPKEDVCQPNGC
jgi:hypothetical protein